MGKDKRLMEGYWWERPTRLRGKLGLVLLGGAMLSESLIQLSVDGWSCVQFSSVQLLSPVRLFATP